MKRNIAFILTFFMVAGLCFGGGFVAHAQTNVLDPICDQYRTLPDDSDQKPTVCKENGKPQTIENNSIFGPNGIFTKAASLVSILVGIASIIMIMVGGLRYIMSSGDASNIKSAKDTILYAIIGLGVAAFAQAIIIFVLKRLE